MRLLSKNLLVAIVFVVSLLLPLINFTRSEPVLAATQWVQTTQSDFNTGTLIGVDSASSSGNIRLAKATGKYYVYATQGNPDYPNSYGGGVGFWRYDIAANSWTAMADFPVSELRGGALVSDGTYIYALRGWGSVNGTREFYRYDPALNSWTRMADTPDPDGVFNGSLTCVGNIIYAEQGGNQWRGFWGYNISDNTWSDASYADPPGTYNIHFGNSLANDGTNVYLTAGDGRSEFSRYSIAGNSWDTRTDTPNGTSPGSGTTRIGGTIYWTRGGNSSDFSGYSISGNSWSLLAYTIVSGTTYNISVGGALTNDGTYVYALKGDFSPGSPIFLRYNPGDNTWSRLQNVPGNVSAGAGLATAQGYSTSGTLASQVFDTGANGTGWNQISWLENTATNTDVTFEVRASDSAFTKDSATPSWTSIGGTTPVSTGLPSGRYMQWRATLTTSNQAITPVLSEVVVDYTAYGTPTITNVNPGYGYRGYSTSNVIITGTNFTGASNVSFGTGITVGGFTVNSDTQITVSLISIDGAAAPGNRNVTVTSPAGTGTGTNAFNVKQKFATVYVNGTSGNDNYDGSSPAYSSGITGPKKTIKNGIDAVLENGTVNVAAGTYKEYRVRLSETMNLVGAGALTTIIDAEGKGGAVEVSSAPNQRNTISGFTIMNAAPYGSDCGGGLYISQAHIVTLNDCAIINNTKGAGSSPLPGLGGGICNNGGMLYMNRCTVSGNSSSGAGGGVYTRRNFGGDSGLVEMVNCTVSGNTVTGDGATGGGLHCAADASIKLQNVTVAYNRATHANSFGGGFSNGSVSSMYFQNCIVANNTAGRSQYNNGYNGVGTGVNSLGNNIDSENSCYFNQTTDLINTNPLLGTLQNNGGTTSTHAIPQNSPALNRGSSTAGTDMPALPATDQRGASRPQGSARDIGAFELIYTVNTSVGSGAATFSTNAGSLNSLSAPGSVPCGALLGVSFPFGFFSFTVAPVTAGGTATITMTLPSPVSAGAQYWKCINGSWVNCSSLLGHNDGDNILTLTITDGGLGDADGLANGIITDPGGIGVAVAAAPSSSGANTFSSAPALERPHMSPARIVTKYLDVQATAQPNQPVTITASIANSGDAAGSYTATLKINGEVEQVKTGRLNGRGAVPLEFTVYRDKPGQYIAEINGQSSAFTITGSSNVTDISKYIPITGFVVCLIGIIIVCCLLMQRRRSMYS